ncbi:hypothetical protein MPER_05856 [Moniliophthora perniciosa FA553]|nr:hypothetical protein MPER_05856 [Moniliophthora perniciosa FA553]
MGSTPPPPLAQPQPQKTHLHAPADDDSEEDESEEEESEDDDDIYGRPDDAPKQDRLAPQTKSPSPIPSAVPSPALRTQQPPSQPEPPTKSHSPIPPPKSQSPIPPPKSHSPVPPPKSHSPIPPPKLESPAPLAQRQPYRQPSQPLQNRRESVELDLAAVLGGGIRLISFDGEDGDPLPASPSEDQGEEGARPPSPGRIAPIVIRERERTPAFSVTSRPKHKASVSVDMLRQSGGSSGSGTEGLGLTTTAIASAWKGTGDQVEMQTQRPRPRPRSSTLGSMPSMYDAAVRETSSPSDPL